MCLQSYITHMIHLNDFKLLNKFKLTLFPTIIENTNKSGNFINVKIAQKML